MMIDDTAHVSPSKWCDWLYKCASFLAQSKVRLTIHEMTLVNVVIGNRVADL